MNEVCKVKKKRIKSWSQGLILKTGPHKEELLARCEVHLYSAAAGCMRDKGHFPSEVLDLLKPSAFLVGLDTRDL